MVVFQQSRVAILYTHACLSVCLSVFWAVQLEEAHRQAAKDPVAEKKRLLEIYSTIDDEGTDFVSRKKLLEVVKQDGDDSTWLYEALEARDDILVEREVYVQLVDDHLGTGDEGAVAM